MSVVKSCLGGVDRLCVLVLMVWLQGVGAEFHCDFFPCVAKCESVEW